MDIQATLLFITASVNSLLSLFVLFGKRDKTNIVYSIFVLFASLWAIGLGFFILETNLINSLYIADFYYISAIGIPVFFLYFSLIFLNKSISKWLQSKWLQFLTVIPLLLIISFFLIDKNFLIKEVFIATWGKDVVLNNFNYIIYAVFFLVVVMLAYIKLFNTLHSTTNVGEKNQLKFVIWGTAIGFIFGMIFNLFLPFIGNYKYIFIGPLFSFSMVVSIAYSITKHHLFDIKVIATEILIFILWVFIFIRMLFSVSTEDQIANAGLLVISVTVGIFLIRSVIKEVRLREEVEKLATDLKTANEGQASLMHFMNHQIKGRFGNTKNIFAELLTGDYGNISAEAVPLLQKGLDEANVGINYVQGILKGDSAEKGVLPYDKKLMDFRSLVENVGQKQREYAEKKGLIFDLKTKSGDYSINGDVTQLGEAVRNLIDNSINYTQVGSIDVSLFQKDKSILLKISDTGVGISEDDRLKLFKAGGRGADSLKINVNATGYGLVFVKNVAEAHGGRVWVESAGRGKGSTFYLELPLS